MKVCTAFFIVIAALGFEGCIHKKDRSGEAKDTNSDQIPPDIEHKQETPPVTEENPPKGQEDVGQTKQDTCKPLFPPFTRDRSWNAKWLDDSDAQKDKRIVLRTTPLTREYAGDEERGAAKAALGLKNTGYNKGHSFGPFAPAAPFFWPESGATRTESNYFPFNFRFDNDAVLPRLPEFAKAWLKNLDVAQLDVYFVAQEMAPLWNKKLHLRLDSWLLANSDRYDACADFTGEFKSVVYSESTPLSDGSGIFTKDSAIVSALTALPEDVVSNFHTHAYWSLIYLANSKEAIITLHWLLGYEHFPQCDRIAQVDLGTTAKLLERLAQEPIFTKIDESKAMLSELSDLFAD